MSKSARSYHQALAALSLCLAIGTSAAFAQNSASVDTSAPTSLDEPARDNQERLERLNYIQEVLTSKIENRRALGDQIESANEQDKADLRKDADGWRQTG